MANTVDPTHSDDEHEPSRHDSGHAVAARWPDFYALLKVAPDSSDELLRTRIREAYMEATANADHRNIARRIHFQTMVERIVPQARRILLDPELRAKYDEQLSRHKNGDASARSYGDFLKEVPGSGAFGSNPTSSVAVPARRTAGDSTQSDIDHATSEAAAFGDADVSAEEHPFWSDLAISDESVAAAEKDAALENDISEFAASALTPPSETRPSAPEAHAPPSPATPPAQAPSAQETTVAPAETAAPPAPAVSAPVAAPDIAAPAAAPASAPPAPAPTPAPETAAAAAPAAPAPSAIPAVQAPPKTEVPEGEVRAQTVPAAQVAALSNKDVVLTPDAMRGGRIQSKGMRVRPSRDGGSSGGFVSRTVQMLITGIVAAGLTIFILRANQPPTRVPFQVVYAPGLEKVMQAEQAQFAASPAGATAQLLLRPMDGRAAMMAALNKDFNADIWIPSETLWSDRYSAVAGQKGALPLQQSRSLALSPSVLVVRADRAASLRRRFPNHVIPSWDALRGAIVSDASGHFGLGDPVKSGSGAVARYFMAKEWSTRHGRDLTPGTVGDPGLWRWMAGFEDNVPVSARLSSDMVKDLALGTGDRYWWAVALESEAIGWIQDGKELEIWYLPQTNYADHPLASWDRGEGAATAAARAAFEALLRSEKAQQVLLQHGLRPTGIELTTPVQGNPFTDSKMRARGLKTSGFRVVERIPYRTLNALAAAWAERYS